MKVSFRYAAQHLLLSQARRPGPGEQGVPPPLQRQLPPMAATRSDAGQSPASSPLAATMSPTSPATSKGSPAELAGADLQPPPLRCGARASLSITNQEAQNGHSKKFFDFFRQSGHFLLSQDTL